MKPFRLIVDVILLAAGAGAGIYWGVNHPTQATSIASREHIQALRLQIAASQAKIEVLQKFGHDSSDAQQALAAEQQKLAAENQDLASQPSP